MKKRLIYLGICLVVVFILLTAFLNVLISPSVTITDIEIEGTIIPYEHDDSKMLVELNIERLKEETGDHLIYLVTKEFNNVSFIREQGYYAPNDHIAWWISDEKLRYRIEDEIDINTMSFKIPKSKGEYKLKFTIKPIEELQKKTDLEILYVHMEKRYGKDLTWLNKFLIPTNLK